MKDEKIKIIFNKTNLGVGGAVVVGFKEAEKYNVDFIIKIDSDDQMDCSLIPFYKSVLENGNIDFIKGNRFFELKGLKEMPLSRLIGNAGLSFLSKFSTGYYQLMDPTNGFIGIQSKILKHIDLEKLDKRYFFETDLIYRLGLLKANIAEIYAPARYQGEQSNLNIYQSLFVFFIKNINRSIKRIFYSYFLREVNLGSFAFVSAILLLLFGILFGLYKWIYSFENGFFSSSGTVMLAALPIIIGFQFLILFLNYDITYLANNHKGVRTKYER